MWTGHAEAVIAGGLRWLRGDVSDVVAVVPRQRARPSVRADRLDLAAALQRWAAQLTRRRATAVTRRGLLIALPLALIPALVVLASGGSRPFWVLAVLAPAFLGGVVALTRHVSAPQAARLLDRRLGLHDQLGTALELQAGPVPSGGLAAMVLAEANQAIRRSVSTARVVDRHAGVEWAGVGIAVCALALVIAVPRHGAASRASARGPNLAGARSATGGGRRTATPPASARPPSSTAAADLPKGIAPTRWTGARSPANRRARVTVAPHSATAGRRRSSGLSAVVGRGAASPAKLGGVGGGGRAAAGAGQGTGGAGAGVGKADRSSPQRRSGAGTAPGAAAAEAGVGAARSRQRTQGTPGGATAGTVRATVSHRLGVVPTLGGSRQLPLAARGSLPAPAGRSSAHTGQSQTPNGGGGSAGRGGRAGAGPLTGTDFAPVPATSNAPASADDDLLQSFFGTTDQLSFAGW